jgi:hypothetical protein
VTWGDGDLRCAPYVVDRQSWNSKDANALIVYNSNYQSLGFIDREAASFIGPLLRAGFFKELNLDIVDHDDIQEEAAIHMKKAELLCRLTIQLEPARKHEFDLLCKQEEECLLMPAGKLFAQNNTFRNHTVQRISSSNCNSSNNTGIGIVRASSLKPSVGFVRASELQRAVTKDSEIVKAHRLLIEAMNNLEYQKGPAS